MKQVWEDSLTFQSAKMRKINSFSDEPDETIEVTKAQFIGDFAIQVSFNDGSQKLVDFKPFIEKSLHPKIRKYLKENKFIEFQIVD